MRARNDSKDFFDPSEPEPSDPVVEQAVSWFLKIESAKMPEQEREAFQHWLSQDPTHAIAWQRISAMGQDIARLSHNWQAVSKQALNNPAKPVSRRMAAKALGMILVGGGAVAAYDPLLVQRARADHTTGTGETTDVQIDQGRKLRLNTRTAVNISADNTSVRLVEGEVLVDISDTPHGRPLSLKTPAGVLSAGPSRLVLRTFQDGLRIVLLRGEATLSGQRAPLPANSARRLSSSGISDDPSAMHLDPTAWIDGQLRARDAALVTFCKELWRYRTGWVMVDPSVAAQRVSGLFQLSDTDGALRAVAASKQLSIRSIAGILTRIGPRV